MRGVAQSKGTTRTVEKADELWSHSRGKWWCDSILNIPAPTSKNDSGAGVVHFRRGASFFYLTMVAQNLKTSFLSKNVCPIGQQQQNNDSKTFENSAIYELQSRERPNKDIIITARESSNLWEFFT